jgi:catechol 2,3-dioxygenase-like lactoylglutathione lyase family enzyme
MNVTAEPDTAAPQDEVRNEQVIVWPESQRPAWMKALERPAPITRVARLGGLIFEKPDLALARRFLEDFGLVMAASSAKSLDMRGTGPFPLTLHARHGPRSRFVGLIFETERADDLPRLVAEAGAVPSTVGDRFGARGVQLVDPAGFEVHVVEGGTRLVPLALRASDPASANSPARTGRVNHPVRPPLGPAQVVQCAHVVLQVCDFPAASRWYMRTLGLLPSDVQVLPDGEPNLAFLRFDRGTVPADHHAVVLAGGVENAYMHSAYEVADLDAMGQGQQYLRARGWRHAWGIGRHYLGSQLFDYWFDPFGHEMEHMADSDRFDATVPPGYSLFDRKSLWMWGQDLPAHMAPPKNPLKLLRVLGSVLRGDLQGARVRQVVKAMSQRPRSWLS